MSLTWLELHVGEVADGLELHGGGVLDIVGSVEAVDAYPTDSAMFCSMTMSLCSLTLGDNVMSFDVASNKVVIEDSWRDLSITYC